MSRWGWPWVRVCFRDATGDVVAIGVQQGLNVADPGIEEARACIFAMTRAWEANYRNVIIEGDSLMLISKSKRKGSINNELGLFIDEIVSLLNSFSFVSWSNTKRVSWSNTCLLYTSPSPRDGLLSRMPSSA